MSLSEFRPSNVLPFTNSAEDKKDAEGIMTLRECMRREGVDDPFYAKWSAYTGLPVINGRHLGLTYLQIAERLYMEHARSQRKAGHEVYAQFEFGGGANGPLKVNRAEFVSWAKDRLRKEIVRLFASRSHEWLDTL
jgi:hypothetical protein